MTGDVHTLVGAYALDALDDLERAAFDRHLRECEACRYEADDLRETAARLADGAWSVPPPSLRESVLTEIANTRQVAPATVATAPARPRRLRLVAAAAAVVAVVAAGTAVVTVQEQRVREAQALATAAQARETRVRSVLAAPDVVIREEPLTSGGRVTVASSRLRNAGVIMLAADGAPPPGQVYQLWTIRGETPASEGALGTGQSASVQLVEGLPGASAVGVTVERAPSATTPTTPLEALVALT
ncbi:anti-sigma factor domain-containing protein [Actinoplanes sp. GCM10030250]|uniref:anti-sigma factor n=1 Tax=Actinoplanes sp. GCM10030250 TaxID=3273376 RepID=UPI003623D6CA